MTRTALTFRSRTAMAIARRVLRAPVSQALTDPEGAACKTAIA